MCIPASLSKAKEGKGNGLKRPTSHSCQMLGSEALGASMFLCREGRQGVRWMRCRNSVQNGATVRKTHKRECNIRQSYSRAKAVSRNRNKLLPRPCSKHMCKFVQSLCGFWNHVHFLWIGWTVRIITFWCCIRIGASFRSENRVVVSVRCGSFFMRHYGSVFVSILSPFWRFFEAPDKVFRHNF